ncbi:MAG TPA: outer membrane beta-barrel protein [Puia sp.]|nr:outer membrane beta-barrel protein [Puia sp.]
MKESNFYSDEFEQLIRDKTEQYKMYPSENVWKGVHNSLHTKRKWFIGSMAVLVTGILFMAGKELIAPPNHPTAARKIAAAAGSVADVPKTSASANVPHTPLTAYHVAASPAIHAAAGAGNTNTEQDPAYKGIDITISNPVLDQSDLSEWLSRVVRLPEHAPDLPVVETRNALAEQWRVAADHNQAQDVTRSAGEVPGLHRELAGETAVKEEGDDARNEALAGVTGNTEPASSRPNRAATRSSGQLEDTRAGAGMVTGKDVSNGSGTAAKADAAAIAEADDIQRINWLRDYAMSILPPSPKRGRTFLQLSLAPTLNYRTLNGVDPQMEKFGMANTGRLNPSPGLGFEVGGSILYRLTRNLSIKAGLQFNFIRYQIGTYTINNSQNAAYLTQLGWTMDSAQMNRARMSNPNSAVPTKTVVTLDNDYYQLSAPIGFELRVLGNERLQLHVGATVQPSYLLSTSAYMPTEDYTEYNRQPAMFRKWNISGGVEAFLTYRMGNVRWQVGPEFRYQFLSSYMSKYPVTGDQYPFSENLKSYGIRIGIVKPLP